jgi:hypothetical protein
MPRLNKEQWETIDRRLADGVPVSEIARDNDVSRVSVYRRINKSKGDPRPGGEGKKPATKRKAGKKVYSDEQLTQTFAQIASAPAIPMALFVHCDFCAAHFATTGPVAAAKLVELSHEHGPLRNVLEFVQRYADEVAWAGILTMYAGVPIAHHLAPEFVYRYLRAIPGINLPPRDMPTHAHAGNGASPEGEPFNPLAGLDLETVLNMAQSMGVEVPPEVLMSMMGENGASEADPTESETGITESPDITETALGDTDAAATETGTGEAVATDAPDSDTGE